MATVNTLPLSIVVHLAVGGINRSYSAPDEYTKAGQSGGQAQTPWRRPAKEHPGPRHQARNGKQDNISARFIGRFSGHAGADLRLNKSGLYL